jgi:hypothetical protein
MHSVIGRVCDGSVPQSVHPTRPVSLTVGGGVCVDRGGWVIDRAGEGLAERVAGSARARLLNPFDTLGRIGM